MKSLREIVRIQSASQHEPGMEVGSEPNEIFSDRLPGSAMRIRRIAVDECSKKLAPSRFDRLNVPSRIEDGRVILNPECPDHRAMTSDGNDGVRRFRAMKLGDSDSRTFKDGKHFDIGSIDEYAHRGRRIAPGKNDLPSGIGVNESRRLGMKIQAKIIDAQLPERTSLIGLCDTAHFETNALSPGRLNRGIIVN